MVVNGILFGVKTPEIDSDIHYQQHHYFHNIYAHFEKYFNHLLTSTGSL